MGRLTVSDDGEYFVKDGRKMFILCDTVWSAIYNIADNEWRDYLDYRRMQGYNAVQFNVLHQWDSGAPDLGIYPFHVNDDGTFDFYKFNDDYFAKARRMMEVAAEKGFMPIPFVLHASYTAGTWAVKGREEYILPFEQLRPLAKLVAETFKGLDPLYVANADTAFDTEASKQYAWEILKAIKEWDPESICTFHLGSNVDLPEEFSESELYGCYALQPGHCVANTDFSYKMILDYYKKKKKRPIINDEFFYEGYGYTGEYYGRYNEFDQRRSIWQSILSGAKGGLGYGAQGVWGWNSPYKDCLNVAHGHYAFTWQTALRFPGAWEGPFAKYIFELYDLFDLVPLERICNSNVRERNEIRMAKTKDGSKVLIYVPYSVPIKVFYDLSEYDFTLIDMKNKHFGKPVVNSANGGAEIKMYDFNADALLIGVKR